MLENNKDYPADIAINYLGRKITYKELFENIDKTVSAFIKAGVKEKDIVTIVLPSIPEALYFVCTELLPDYMIPEEIEIRADLPRTSRGKIDYWALGQESGNK